MIIGCCRGNWNLWWTSFSLVGLSFFPWPPVGLSSLGLRPRLDNWPPFGLGKKKSNLGKRSSSLVSFLYRPINVLETEYIFPWLPIGLSSRGGRPRLVNWPPFGRGKKKSNLGKKSSSLVSFLYRPNNVLETEYIFLFLDVKGICNSTAQDFKVTGNHFLNEWFTNT